MQAQSRFAVNRGGSSSSVPEDKHEAVVRELTRGHELTAKLRAEALQALRGQGQAADTAAFILQEVSRAFNVCLSIMNSPARAMPPRPRPEMPSPVRQNRDENVPPRRVIVTYEPFSDGYMWRKYGQKKITNTRFPRCYFRCSYHRERGCPVTKQVQQHSAGDPPKYVVVYVNEHTCDTSVWEPKASSGGAAANPVQRDDQLPAGLMARGQQHGGLLGERGAQEEHERQVLVSSLASVLGAQYSPACSSSGGGAFGQQQELQGAPASDSAVDPNCGGGELPWLDEDVDAAGLDVMDYDMTAGNDLYFDGSYGLHGRDLSF